MELKDIFANGVSTGLLLIFAFAVWKIIQWVKTNLAEPVIKAHLELIEVLKIHSPKQSETSIQHAVELRHQTEVLSEIATCNEVQVDELKKQSAILEKHSGQFEKIAKWPSDPIKICQAEEIISERLKEALAKVLAAQEKFLESQKLKNQ